MAGQRKEVPKFVLKKASLRWGAQASRLALEDLLTLKPNQRKYKAKIMSSTAGLIGRWRQRQYDLREAGWSDIEGGANFVFSLSCPPVGVMTAQTGFLPCRRQRICPWCWCRRYVIEVFEKFQALILPSPLKKQKKYDLCWIDSHIQLPVGPNAVANGIEWWQDHRRDYIHKELKESVGTFVLFTIEPPMKSIERPNYLLRRRIFTAVPCTMELPDFEHYDYGKARVETLVMKRFPSPGRGKLAEAVGEVCKYPPILMKGKAADVVDILKRSKGMRMSSTFGGLRGKPN